MFNIAVNRLGLLAFDPLRQAIVLCIADKGGKKRFYKDMLDIADEEYKLHLSTLGE